MQAFKEAFDNLIMGPFLDGVVVSWHVEDVAQSAPPEGTGALAFIARVRSHKELKTYQIPIIAVAAEVCTQRCQSRSKYTPYPGVKRDHFAVIDSSVMAT